MPWLKIASTVKRGKKTPVVIEPLSDAPAPTVAPDKITAALTAIRTAVDVAKLDAIEKHANSLGIHETPEIRDALIDKRAELEGRLDGS